MIILPEQLSKPDRRTRAMTLGHAMARVIMDQGFVGGAVPDYYRNRHQATTQERLNTLTASMLLMCDPRTGNEFLQRIPVPLQAVWKSSYRKNHIDPSTCDTATIELAERLPHVFPSRSAAKPHVRRAVRELLQSGVEDVANWITQSIQTGEPLTHATANDHPTIQAATTLTLKAQEAAFFSTMLETPSSLPVDHDNMVALATRGLELASTLNIELGASEDPRPLDEVGNCPAANAPNWRNALVQPVLSAYTGIYPIS